MGSVLRANISLFVIVFSLAGSIGGAAAQYLPPQPPPVGYPPPPSYPSPASPPRYPGADPRYSDQYEDPYNDLYPPRPPRLVYPSPYGYPAGPSRYSGANSYGLPGPMPPPQGTAIAALPPEYRPERAPAELPPRFHRTLVDYPTLEPAGTIIIDTPNTYLYLAIGHGKAIRYGIGVGREGFASNRIIAVTTRPKRRRPWTMSFSRCRGLPDRVEFNSWAVFVQFVSSASTATGQSHPE